MAENFFLKTPLEAFTDSISSAPEQQPSIPSAPRNQGKTSSLLPSSDLMPVFEASARQFNVPVNVLMALSSQESSYNKNAIGSPTKWGRAKGIMQYLDGTAKDLGINPFNPDEAIPAAAKQLRQRLDKGASMEDAIKEHFAGPDRKLWGDKTHAYGQQVMDRVIKIGQMLVGDGAKNAKPAAAELQAQLDKQDPGKYQVIDDNYLSNHFSPALPRPVYEYGFKMLNPGADDSAVQNAMKSYDAAHAKDSQQKAQGVIDRFDALKSPEAMFQQRLDQRLAGPKNGILPQLPTRTDLLANYNKEVAKEEAAKGGNALTDLGKNLKVGVNAGAQDVRELIGKIPYVGDAALKAGDEVDKYFTGKNSEELLKSDSEQMIRSMTPEMQSALKKQWWDSDKGRLGPAWSDWRSYVGGLTQSLPEQALMMVPSMQLAKSIYAAKVAAGASAEVAGKAAARAAMLAGSITEGGLGGAQSSREVRDEVLALPDDVIAQSDAFKSLVDSGMSPQEAKKSLADSLSTRAFITAGVATGLFGGQGDRVIARLMTDRVAKSSLKNMLVGGAKGMVGEGVFEELPQSVAQQFSQNEAVSKADKNKSLTADVVNQGLGGLVLGGLMGSGMGGVASLSNRNSQEDKKPEAIQEQSFQPQATASQPAATAEQMAPQQQAPSPQTVETVTPPAPSTASGPLTQSIENAAAQPERIKVMAPQGEISGFLLSHAQDDQGNFEIKMVGDNGQPYRFTNNDGVQIVQSGGPLHSAMERAAETHAAEKAKAPDAQSAAQVQSVAPAVQDVPVNPQPDREIRLEDMTEPELRDRMKYLAQQAKNTGGWNKLLMTERRKVEKQINKLKETENAGNADAVSVRDDGTGSAGQLAQDQQNQQPAAEGNAKGNPEAGKDTGESAQPGRAGVSDANKSAEQSAELKNEYASRRFSYKDKAEAFIAKNNIGDTHEVVQTGKARFAVQPKATVKESLTAKPANVEAIDTSAKRVEKPQENVQVKSEAAPARMYDVVSVNEKTGKKTKMNGDALTHDEAVAMKGKINNNIEGRRVQLEEVQAPKPEASKVAKAKTPSWVIKNKATGEVVMETYDQKKVDALNTEKYEAVPILGHLQSLNKKEKENGDNQRTSGEPNGSEAVAGKQAAERPEAGNSNANAAGEEKAQGKKEVGTANNRTDAERELESVFKGLASRGKKTKQAAEAKVSGHPREAQIRYVEQNFYELLSDLDESGLVKIVC